MKPIGDNVIIQQDEEVKKIGSIIVPDSHTKSNLHGTVLGVGSNVKELKEGDRVHFSPVGFEYIDKDKMILLIPESSVLYKEEA